MGPHLLQPFITPFGHTPLAVMLPRGSDPRCAIGLLIGNEGPRLTGAAGKRNWL